MANYRVKIFGPNLSGKGQDQGQFHVHLADCSDCRNYGPGKRFGGDYGAADEPTVVVASAQEVVLYVYDNGIMEEAGHGPEDWGQYASEFYFAPCTRAIPPEAQGPAAPEVV